MILFCEECGEKNSFDGPTAEDLRQSGFECVHCASRTPPASIQGLQPQQGTNSSQKTSQVTWGPNLVSFGTVAYNAEARRRITFQPKNDDIIDLTFMVRKEVQNDLEVRWVAPQTVELRLLPFSTGAGQNRSFTGPAIHFADINSDFRCEAQVTFNRRSSSLTGLSETIDLGNMSSGVISNNVLVIENSGAHPLLLQLKLDPNDFSIAARFIINSALAMTLSPKEKITIPYTVWPAGEIAEDWTFRQHIEVTTNEPGLSTKKRVVLTGKVIAAAG